MMRYTNAPLTPPSPTVLVLGMFDGVHQGHQALLRLARELADRDGLTVTALTFQRHPLAVLGMDAPQLLSTLPERAAAMAACRVDVMCALPFTLDLARKAPEDFLTFLADTFHPRHIVAGFNYTFGDKGAGTSELLCSRAGSLGYEAHIVPPVIWHGEPVSSSRIRAMLTSGDLAGANCLMGRLYAISGRVEQGKHIGRTIGFPTANIRIPPHKLLPAYGVYAGLLKTPQGEFPCVLNVGRHPTLPAGHVTLEAHVLGIILPLYDEKVMVSFLKFMRSERIFPSVDELKAQILTDARQAQAYFSGAGTQEESQ